MRKLTIVLLLMLCAPVWAESTYFDAAKRHWDSSEMEYDQAMVVIDARIEAQSGVEINFTSAEWGTCGAWEGLGGTVWDGLVSSPEEIIRDGKRWRVGMIQYTPGSRPECPSYAPITFWETLEQMEMGPDLWMPVDQGEIIGYVPQGFIWAIAMNSWESLFHSPATATVAGVDYEDPDIMPNFTGFIPEPATMVLLLFGIPVALRKRR